MAQADSDIPIFEPTRIFDTFATELATVETLGACVRLTFAIRQKDIEGEDDERVVVAKMVLPTDAALRITTDLPAMMLGDHDAEFREARVELH